MTDPDRCRSACEAFNAAPYYQHLGLQAASEAPGTSRVTLVFARHLTQVYGGVHGGALLSLADSAIGVAVATTLAEDEAIATVELSMQFLAPPGDNDVVAEGTVSRRGRRLGFGRCVMRAGDVEVGRAQAILYVGSKEKMDRSQPA